MQLQKMLLLWSMTCTTFLFIVTTAGNQTDNPSCVLVNVGPQRGNVTFRLSSKPIETCFLFLSVGFVIGFDVRASRCSPGVVMRFDDIHDSLSSALFEGCEEIPFHLKSRTGTVRFIFQLPADMRPLDHFEAQIFFARVSIPNGMHQVAEPVHQNLLAAERGLSISINESTSYHHNANYIWNVTSGHNTTIKAILTIHQIELCYNCQCDKVELFDSGSLITRSCRSSRQIFKTHINQLIVHFAADSSVIGQSAISGSNVGFDLQLFPHDISSDGNACNKTYKLSLHPGQRLEIANRGLYRNNIDCLWEVEASENSRIEYFLTIHWIEYCINCSCDFLALSDTLESLWEPKNLSFRDRECTERTMTYGAQVTKGNKLYARFMADSTILPPKELRDYGFSLTMQSVPNNLCRSTRCIRNVTDGFLSNDEYPAAYNKNVRCEWLIEVRYGAHIRIVINSSRWEPCMKSSCSSCDHVAIYEGHLRKGRPIVELCNRDQSKIAVVKSNLAIVFFHTDNNADMLKESEISQPIGFRLHFSEEWEDDSNNLFTLLIITMVPLSIIVLAAILLSSVQHCLKRGKRILEMTISNVPFNYYVSPNNSVEQIVKNSGDPIFQATFVDLLIEKRRLDTKSEEVLGRGGFAVVTKAVLRPKISDKDRHDKVVAVKSLKPLYRESMLLSFLKEAVFMKSLDHPNVLSIIGISIINGSPKVIMPFMKNGNLKHYLKLYGRNHTNKTLVRFCLEVSSGMEYLSSMKLIHRDLACRNILVDENGGLKIGDFGLAREVSKISSYVYTATGENPLPARWHPPESFELGKFEIKSDVWSFGIVCWEIFSECESDPYVDWDLAQVKTLICSGARLSRPHRCTETFYVNVILPCWNKIISQRPYFSELRIAIEEHMSLEAGDEFYEETMIT